jgi:hypothetical protein
LDSCTLKTHCFDLESLKGMESFSIPGSQIKSQLCYLPPMFSWDATLTSLSLFPYL